MPSVEETIKQRFSVHGDYANAATFKDRVISQCTELPNWKKLGPSGRETVRMIVEKLGRIMFGDCGFPDHWHDIAGYATLMERVLESRPGPDRIEIPLTYEEGSNG